MSELLKPKSNKPLRLALLGDTKVGKSTFIQGLTMRTFVETYYPTLKSTPIMLEWVPNDEISKTILNEFADVKDMGPIIQDDRIVLCPLIVSVVSKNSALNNPGKLMHQHQHHRSSSSKQMKKVKKNSIYSVVYDESHESAIAPSSSPSSSSSLHAAASHPNFHITPILLELIDTPPFNPSQVVPFLEASLDIKLSPDILHNLANEPRRDHSAKPLIVASGAHDMNGNIDGYFFVYSAIPSLNPPGYEEPDAASAKSPLALLKEMKTILDEAWKEYTSYKKGWEIGGEGDVFSFVYSVKSLWKKQSAMEKLAHANENDYYKPPVLVVCTHCDSELKSPKLIREGKELALLWKCGFMEMDNLNVQDIDVLTSLLVRHVVEDNFARSG